MEIRAEIVVKGSIEYNRQEIEAGLLVLENKYNGMLFVEEDIKTAKEERANLNKVVKAIDTYRKQVVGEAMEPVKEFETFMKDASKRANNLSAGIGDQIKSFEDEKKKERLEMVKKYIKEITDFKPAYQEFMDQLDLSEAIFTNAGSFGKVGEPGTKLVEYIGNKLHQADEVLEARELKEKSLQEKRDLIVSTCKSTSNMLKLKMNLSPKTFGYLKDYDLAKIVDEINRAGQEQQEKEIAVIEKLKKEADEKARIELEKEKLKKEAALKKELEDKEKNKSVEKVDKILVENLEINKPNPIDSVLVEPKKEKTYNFTLSMNEVNLKMATELKSFLDNNHFKYELKMEAK